MARCECSPFFNTCISTASNIYPANRRQQLQKFSQPTLSRCTNCTLGWGWLPLHTRTHFVSRAKKVRIEKTIYSHTSPSSHKNERERKKNIYRYVSRIQSHETFTKESKISHCHRLTRLLEDLRIFYISIYKCSYKILAQMLQIHVCVCITMPLPWKNMA